MGERVGLGPQFLSPCQIEGRQRRIEMKIEDRGGTRLTIGEARKLFAIAEEKLDLEPCYVKLHEFVAMQFQIGGG